MGWPPSCGLGRRRRGLSATLPLFVVVLLLLLLFFSTPGTALTHRHTGTRHLMPSPSLCSSLQSALEYHVRELTPSRRTTCLVLPSCRDVWHAGEGERRLGGAADDDDGGGGRVLLVLGPGGGAPGAGGAGVVAAHLPQPLRGLPPLPTRPRRHPARPELPARVLPGGLALQVRQQALHALTQRQRQRQRQRRRHLSLLRTR